MKPTPHPAADRLTRFSDRAGAYASHRPSYSNAAIDAVLEGLDPAHLRAADVGAGTGISARLLADRGCDVVAIEPNAAMRDAAIPHAGVRWIDATGERTTLNDRSMDLVLCAQAFHWLDAPAALAEFHRVLHTGGRVALVWNVQDDSWEASRRYKAAVVEYATEPPTSPWFLPVGEPLKDAPGFANARLLTFPNAQSHDREGLIGRALSASYAPREGTKHTALVAALNSIFDDCAVNGSVTLKYITEVHLAETLA